MTRAAWLAAVVLAVGPRAHAQLALRGEPTSLAADIESVGPGGVDVRLPGGVGRRVYSWDLVRSVETPEAPVADELLRASTTAWRARSRLQRGDEPAAEPLFQELFERLGGVSGPTPAVVAEGLLRCRLARGARAAAVEPWLELVRVRREAGVEINTWATPRLGDRDVIDAVTGLCPELPPVWPAGSEEEALAASERWEVLSSADREGGEPRSASLAALYAAAARHAAGLRVDGEEVAGTGDTQDPGVRLVREMLLASVGDFDQRASARIALRSRVEGAETPRWIAAWCIMGIGRSLLREEDPRERRMGVIWLLNLPARFRRDQPYLAGCAIAAAAEALDTMGDRVGATALANDLARRFPGHSALRAPVITRLAGPPANGPDANGKERP